MPPKEEKSEITETKKEEIKEKVEEKIEKAEEKIEAKTGKKINLIGEKADPKINEDFDLKSWSKSVDEKVDKLIAFHEKKAAPDPAVSGAPSPEPPPSDKKIPWYDVELI